MSVVPNSTTLFVIDISAPMGATREVHDLVVTENYTVEQRTRVTTTLEWVCHFVSTRIAEVILRDLKTTKVAVVLYGSSKTNNNIVDAGNTDSYQGIEDFIRPTIPTVHTIDLVQNLRAVSESDKVDPGDPLAALVDAITLSSLPSSGGIRDSSRATKTRTIYLITDGLADFTWAGADSTKAKLIEEGIDLRVLGIDFADPHDGVKRDTDSTKAKNEAFWRDFVGDPFKVATATQALDDTMLPILTIKNPAPTRTLLCFGDPKDLADKRALQIPISLYKMTEPNRPMTQHKISKLAYDGARNGSNGTRPESNGAGPSTEANDDAPTITNDAPTIFNVEIKRNQFLLDQLTGTQNGSKEPEPLPESAAEGFTRAWKLGASLIPVPDSAFQKPGETYKSMEILYFFNASAYRREYNVEAVWYVFADGTQAKAQLQLASFIQAMTELDVLALVRLVRKDGAEPELGILKPQVDPTTSYFFYSKAPFREDLRRFLFPPLDRVITTEGEEMRKGPTIPDADDLEAMSAFVDSMELDADWFKVEESFNPAIHGLKAAVRHRVIHPDDPHVPGPHPSLLKYLEAPHTVRVRGAQAADKCKERFKIAYVPPKSNSGQKKRDVASAQLDDTRDGGKYGRTTTNAEVAAAKSMAPPDDESDETEDESAARPPAPSEPQAATQSSSLLDTSRPVAHFRELVQKDDVTQAVVQLEATIRHLVAQRTYDVAVDCMKAGKTVAQEYEEAMRWNLFARSLKRTLLKDHRAFWESSIKGRYDVGLVTEAEDEAGQSDVTQQDAQEFAETEEL